MSFAPPGFAGDPIIVSFVPTPDLHDDPHEQAAAAEQALKQATTYTFTSRVLEGARWEALIAEHPPQVEGDDYNPDTFCPALIVESVTGWKVTVAGEQTESEARPMTGAEAAELWESWPQWARLALIDPLKVQNIYGPSLGKEILRLRGNAAE